MLKRMLAALGIQKGEVVSARFPSFVEMEAARLQAAREAEAAERGRRRLEEEMAWVGMALESGAWGVDKP